MKDQYFGDVNDYLKYGLLRCFAHAGFRIGVCWMLTPDDGRSDGRKLRYLSQPDLWRAHDPPLFDVLRSTVGAGATRSTSIAEESSLFPRCSFFADLVPDGRGSRSAWLTAALTALSSSDLLFFDPDNGLEVPSTPAGRSGSSKYLYWPEVASAWAGGASLLIFQHFPRETRASYIERIAGRFGEEAPGASVTALVTANVLFLLAGRPEHTTVAKAALARVESSWAGRVSVWGGRGAESSPFAPSDNGKVRRAIRARAPAGVPVSDRVISNAAQLSAQDLARRSVVCPACGVFVFRMWPEGWDAHAAYRCAGLEASTPEERKREFRERFRLLFRSR